MKANLILKTDKTVKKTKKKTLLLYSNSTYSVWRYLPAGGASSLKNNVVWLLLLHFQEEGLCPEVFVK